MLSGAYCPDLSREMLAGIEESIAMSSKTDIKNNQLLDVVILGAGPAGALCAFELSKMQYKVLLINAGKSRSRIEGLSVRAVRLLQSKKMHCALESVSASLPRMVVWGDLTSNENGEHLVARPQFDEGLRRDAENAGAKVIKGRVTHFTQDKFQGYWTVTLPSQSKVRCKFLIDARGRHVNPSGKTNPAPQNIALCAYIDNLSAEPGTQVHANENGWLWLARPNKETPVWAQFMLHKAMPQLTQQSLSSVLLEQVKSTLGQQGLQISGQAHTRGADFRLNTKINDPLSPLRLGDASAAFDPLSGHGIFWAFSSALSGAAIVNTILNDNSQRTQALCCEFYTQRLHSTYWRQARIGRDFYQLEKSRKTLFWQTRKHWPDDQPAHTAIASVPSFDRGPVVENQRVVEQERLLLPGEYGPSAWFGSIPLVSTIRKIQRSNISAAMGLDQFRADFVPMANALEAKQFIYWLQSNGLNAKQLHKIPFN